MNSPAVHAEHARPHFPLYALAAVALVIGRAAQADEISIGGGGGVDRGKTDCVAAYPCDRGDLFGKVYAGYRFPGGLELQAIAFDAGRFQGGDTTPLGTPFGGRFKVRGVGFTAGYRWSFAPQWSLLGQAGVASVRTRFDDSAPFSGDVSQSTTQPLVGLSLAYDIAPKWRLSLDFNETRFKVYTTHGSLRLLGASAQYVF
jgi:hypothetical protein